METRIRCNPINIKAGGAYGDSGFPMKVGIVQKLRSESFSESSTNPNIQETWNRPHLLENILAQYPRLQV